MFRHVPPHRRRAAARPSLAVLPAALLLATAAQATSPTKLDTVQVTASRVERPLDESLASVTVLERTDIEASQAPDLIDLLGRQAGIDVARTGGHGSGSALFMRGGNSTHTLVLVDGIRVNSTGQGVFDFAHLPLEQIERIEIVRGPRASVWGSDALAGVIQIFTRDPSAASARAWAGSYGRVGASAGAGFAGERGGFGVTAGYDHADGFSATNPLAWGHDPDDDGYRNANLSLRGRTTVGGHTLAATAIATRGTVQIDQGVTRARNSSGGVTLAGRLGGDWRHELVLGHAREDLDTLAAFSHAFRSRRTSVDWLHDVATGTGTSLRFGLNWQREDGVSSNAFDGVIFDGDRDSTGVFVAWGGRVGAHVFDLGARRDHSSQYGDADTGHAGWGWDLSDTLQWRLSWGEGFRAPNFNELYYPDTGYGYGGDPDLRPERSRTWEAGLDWRPAPAHRLGLSAYRSRVHDLIAFAAPGTNNAINIDRAELDGVELEYRWSDGGWSAGGNLAWLSAEDAATGQRLLRRADRKAHADIGHVWDSGLSLGVDVDHVSDRPDYGAHLDAFTLVHLRLGWELAPRWRLEARVENLGDRDYAWVHGYNTPGRSVLLSLSWDAAR
ncbi:TonB-dependent receptor domain-containing protein [Arenimonas composti]|uniref:TonB-dependent receptor n=1 Tax=Arenimonas composti TR7-09 = DSM 18010 TaxID=1121013 RepID=A0A091BYG1_9GAMM|nr:TonB-dependent receptor [Arenimonas composti]KFN49375.1 hypothetical protein P873_11420 [Arenimonas composti TR7-09 = DSM 18010]